MSHWPRVYDAAVGFAGKHGIRVVECDMDPEKPGEFDGPTISVNTQHALEPLCYYLLHAVGSIYQWSTDFERSRRTFERLRETKRTAGSDFDAALHQWRRFEETSSDHAVWALNDLGYADVVSAYTVFFRADLEAMTIFHRTGQEPRWPDFFAEWKRNIARGVVHVEPFTPKPITPFTPAKIEKQEVVQEQD